MDHPAKGTAGGEAAQSPSSFRQCQPSRRCGVCKLLTGQGRRERALFKTILSEDAEFLRDLDRLSTLFYDSVTAG